MWVCEIKPKMRWNSSNGRRPTSVDFLWKLSKMYKNYGNAIFLKLDKNMRYLGDAMRTLSSWAFQKYMLWYFKPELLQIPPENSESKSSKIRFLGGKITFSSYSESKHGFYNLYYRAPWRKKHNNGIGTKFCCWLLGLRPLLTDPTIGFIATCRHYI